MASVHPIDEARGKVRQSDARGEVVEEVWGDVVAYHANPRLSTYDFIYAAAITDSRAAFSTRRAREVYLPQVSVSGRPFDVLEWLGWITETRVISTTRDYMRLGCTDHCEEKHLHVESNSGRWLVTGAKATVFLANILPFLKFRQDDAKKLLKIGFASKWKPATVEKMALLGWAIPPEMKPGNVGGSA